MANTNPFDLLVDDDNDDPHHLVQKLTPQRQQLMANANTNPSDLLVDDDNYDDDPLVDDDNDDPHHLVQKLPPLVPMNADHQAYLDHSKQMEANYLAVDVNEEKDAPEENNVAKSVDHSAIAIVELVDSAEKSLSIYTSRDSAPISIYKVPAKLRRVNEEAYNPRLISVGPIHHGRPELQGMERYKWRFLDGFLKRRKNSSLKELATIARDLENRVRQCYQESFDNLSSKEFSEMIMLDGVFLVVLLDENSRREREKQRREEGLKEATSSRYISDNQFVTSDIMHDLMLLENQLPLFVLENFYKYMRRRTSDLEKSIGTFFSGIGNLVTVEKHESVLEIENGATHFERKKSRKGRRHLVDFLRTYYQPVCDSHRRGKTIVYSRNATDLQEAGVKIQGVPCYDIFEIKFLEGKLSIPRLRIDEHTETLLRNLIAFEQCQYDERKDLTSYIIFMDGLINTTKDVDLLVDCGVIQNFLGDHERVASLFNNLHKETVMRENEFYFEELCIKLNEYSKDYWHQLKAKWFRYKRDLRRNYFNTPWSALSVIAAVILLFLTMVQTVCSIVSVLQSK